ncbi:hypothetical protein X971_4782 (plasmid) [Agrobacterium tumefaciens LBA4213 (Ach5)]|nr:hypothetical protein X971_4782 [Agrobacterium tumefaciens LBA4213 (Ach5)]
MTTLSIYHLHLLDDAGFLMPLKIKKQPSISVTFRGLSWSGHESFKLVSMLKFVTVRP